MDNEEVIENPLIKNIGKKITTKMDTVIKDNGDGSLRAIVNSGKEDRHGEVLSIKGLDIKEYMKNPILANSHDYSKPSVGKTLKLTKKEDGSLVADFKFATDVQDYPEPKILDQLYRKGYQFAFSIGFIPEEIDGNTYTKSTMIEFSPVLIPADGNALLLAKKLGLDTEIAVAYNIHNMNLQEILAKAEKDINTLTLGEVAFLKENSEDLTGNQIKKLASILKDGEEEVEDKKEDGTEDTAVAEALKGLNSTIKSLSEEVKGIKDANVEVKDINGAVDKKDFSIGKGKEVSKELKFLHYARGLQTGNFRSYLNIVGKDAMNTSDTGDVLPPAEFILDIIRLEEQVGVAERFADVRRSTTGAGLIYVQGDDDLEIFDTAESGAKKSTKLSYKQLLLGWRKFAGILPITDELNEDSAVQLYQDATNRFARAYARKADELVFTNTASGGNTKNGILHESGTNIVHIDGSMVDITYDNIVDMIYGVPTQSAQNGRFYLNREMLGVLAKLKDQQDRPLWVPAIADGVPATIGGKPYVETEVLPDLSDDSLNMPFMIFGDLRYATLGYRTDLNVKMFDAGTVGDPDEVDQDANTINLLTQDVTAMRAVRRMNAVVRFPAAFSVLKTGLSS